MKLRIVGWREKLKEKNLRRKKEAKDGITAPGEVKREARGMYVKKKNETDDQSEKRGKDKQ